MGARPGRRLVQRAWLLLAGASAALAVSCSPSPPPASVVGTDAPAVPGVAWSGAPDATAGVEPTQQLPPADPAFRLTFQDEFDGNRLNPALWRTGVPWGDVTNTEAQIYRTSALSVDSGVLTMTASRRAGEGKAFTSGAVHTDDLYEYTYGYLEVRARVPAGRGLWPAVWMQSARSGEFNEIDVLEVLGQDPSSNHVNLHKDSNRWKAGTTVFGPDLSKDFHVYAVDWEPERVVWYMDGVEVFRSEGHVLDRPMCIIMNLTVGGSKSWSGPTDSTTPFPSRFDIDYIRVYQRR